MKWLALSLILATGFVAWVTVTALSSGPEGGSDTSDWNGHDWKGPENDEERAALAAATAYVQAIADRRLPDACRFAAARLAARLHCSGRPRLTSGTELHHDGELEPFGVRTEGAKASVHFYGLLPGPANQVSLVREGDAWKVLGHLAYAMA